MSIYLLKNSLYPIEITNSLSVQQPTTKEKATSKIERMYFQFKKNPEVSLDDRAFLEGINLQNIPSRHQQLVTTILRHKAQKTDIFNACKTCIHTKAYDKLQDLLTTSKRYGINPSSPQGKTLLTTALMNDDTTAMSILKQGGMNTYFSFNLDEEHWIRAVSLILGQYKSTHLVQPLPGSSQTFAATLTHHLWGMFQQFVRDEKAEWQKLVPENSMKKIGDCIINILSPDHETAVSRIQKGLPVIVMTSDGSHVMTLVFVQQHLFYCNRGKRFEGQEKNIELYQCDTSTVTEELLYKICTLENKQEADTLIYGKLKKILKCKRPQNFCSALAQFKDLAYQKSENCTIASIKTAIFTLLLSEHSESLTTEKLNALYKIYKAVTAFFRVTIEAKFIEYKRNTQSIYLL